MASIGNSCSSPFIIERNGESKAFVFSTFRSRKTKALGVVNGGVSLFYNKGKQLSRFKPLRVASTGDVVGFGDGDDSENSLQATIEKSKKVLAMQRDLLQQVPLSFLISFFFFCKSCFFWIKILCYIYIYIYVSK